MLVPLVATRPSVRVWRPRPQPTARLPVLARSSGRDRTVEALGGRHGAPVGDPLQTPLSYPAPDLPPARGLIRCPTGQSVRSAQEPAWPVGGSRSARRHARSVACLAQLDQDRPDRLVRRLSRHPANGWDAGQPHAGSVSVLLAVGNWRGRILAGSLPASVEVRHERRPVADRRRARPARQRTRAQNSSPASKRGSSAARATAASTQLTGTLESPHGT